MLNMLKAAVRKNEGRTILLLLLFIAAIVILIPVTIGSASQADEIRDLCFQTVSGDSVGSESTSLRFLFTVGSLDYTRVGFVFSDSNEHPTVGGDDCCVYDTDKVYSAVWADGKNVPAPDGR